MTTVVIPDLIRDPLDSRLRGNDKEIYEYQ